MDNFISKVPLSLAYNRLQAVLAAVTTVILYILWYFGAYRDSNSTWISSSLTSNLYIFAWDKCFLEKWSFCIDMIVRKKIFIGSFCHRGYSRLAERNICRRRSTWLETSMKKYWPRSCRNRWILKWAFAIRDSPFTLFSLFSLFFCTYRNGKSKCK